MGDAGAAIASDGKNNKRRERPVIQQDVLKAYEQERELE